MDVFRQARTLWKSFTLKYLILVLQRLEDEYDAKVIITAPTVPYKGKALFGNFPTII
jgi:translation elongation factor EF-4